MSRIPKEVTMVRGCTCSGSVYHRASEPRCALLDLTDAADVQARVDEADARVRAYIDAKNEELETMNAYNDANDASDAINAMARALDLGAIDDKPELFTAGLIMDVVRVIEAHGYRTLDGRQIVELQQHLFHFLHGRARGDTHCTGGVR